MWVDLLAYHGPATNYMFHCKKHYFVTRNLYPFNFKMLMPSPVFAS